MAKSERKRCRRLACHAYKSTSGSSTWSSSSYRRRRKLLLRCVSAILPLPSSHLARKSLSLEILAQSSWSKKSVVFEMCHGSAMCTSIDTPTNLSNFEYLMRLCRVRPPTMEIIHVGLCSRALHSLYWLSAHRITTIKIETKFVVSFFCSLSVHLYFLLWW